MRNHNIKAHKQIFSRWSKAQIKYKQKCDGKDRNNALNHSEKHFSKWASALNDLELNAAARPSLPLHPPGVHRSPLCSSSSSAIPIPPLCSRVCLFQYLTGPVEVHRYAPRAAESDGWPTYHAGSGGSCLILITEPFLPASHPAVRSPGHSRQHRGQPGGSSASEWGPSLSVTSPRWKITFTLWGHLTWSGQRPLRG